MRPSDDDRRAGVDGARRPGASRSLRGVRGGRRLIVAVAATSLVAGVAVAAVSTKPVVLTDSTTDAADGAIDLRRVQLGKGTDGRMRAVVTAAGEWTSKDLVARDGGPPGSICLRLYTVTTKIETTVPEHLVCVTADADGERLRGSVLKERPNDLPERMGTASISRSSKKSVTLKFSQTSIGKPATVRFAAEATRAGCVRTSCVDAAPTPPKVGTFKLREPSATTNRP